MAIDNLDDQKVRGLLQATKRIALIGASDKPERPSNRVMKFLLDCGYDVVPVNPGLAGKEIHGRKVVASMAEAAPLDMVDVFRASDQVEPIATEAVRLGAKSLWMQLGIVNETAAEIARKAGLTVVMDRCPAIERPRLGIAS